MGCGASAEKPNANRWEDYEAPAYKEGDPLPRVWFEVSIDGEKKSQRIEIELFADVAPKTCENFRCLCTGESARARVPLHFKGSSLHRIIPKFMAQGGDIENKGGTGGDSIFEKRRFPDETFEGRAGKHGGLGTLSMANMGPNTNSSQFFMCFADTPHLDGKHVVFGMVTAGLDTLKAIEGVGTKKGTPKCLVVIEDCGEIADETTAVVAVTNGTKDDDAAEKEE